MGTIVDTLVKFWGDTGFANFTYQNGIMIIVSFVFLYLAIRRGFEPLLLVPIAFGMLLSNLPAALDANGLGGMFTEHYNITNSDELSDVGLLTIFYSLKPILPSLIFLGVGAMTDFGPLIANPKCFSWEQRHSWEYSWHSCLPFSWASTLRKPLP